MKYCIQLLHLISIRFRGMFLSYRKFRPGRGRMRSILRIASKRQFFTDVPLMPFFAILLPSRILCFTAPKSFESDSIACCSSIFNIRGNTSDTVSISKSINTFILYPRYLQFSTASLGLRMPCPVF